MSRLDRVLTVVENVVAAGALALAGLIAIVSVLVRAIFGIFFSWSEEATIYLIIYATFIGAVVTLRHNEHVSVDIVPLMLRGRARHLTHVLGAFVTVAYLAVIGTFAWQLIFEPFSTATVTPSLKLPLWVVELSVAIGLTLMFVRALEILYRLGRGRTAYEESEQEALEREAEEKGLGPVQGSPGQDPREEGGR